MSEESSNQQHKITAADEVLNDLDGGVFMQKMAAALADVASGVVTHGRAGQVQITLDMKQIEDSHQVAVKHTLTYKQPTMRGEKGEKDQTSTPLYVGTRGKLSIMPDNQTKFGFMEGNKK